MQQYDFVALRSFAAVVEAGSFKGAASLLQASTAAISRRVSGLEASMGVKLLNRTTRQIDLTQEGRVFYQDLTDIFAAMDHALEKVQRGTETVKGSLRIAAPLSFGMSILSPALPKFMQRYNEIDVQLQLNDGITDLIADGIDVAIRIGKLKDSSLVATHINTIERIFCASPAYIEQFGEPKTLQDLERHNWLQYSLINTKENWLTSHKKTLELSGSLVSNNGDVLKDAIIQGIGISVLPEFIVKKSLLNGDLQEILVGMRPEPLGLYALRPSRQYTPSKVKVLIDYLRETTGSPSKI